MKMSYDIIVRCACCHKLDPISSLVPKDKFLQGFIDRESYYLCCSYWQEFYDRGIEFTLKDAYKPIKSRFDILDIRED